MRKATLFAVMTALLVQVACKKSDNKDSGSNNNNNNGGNNTTTIAANSFKLDSLSVTTTVASANVSSFTSATYMVSFPGSGSDRIGMFFLHKPTASGTFKIKHTYPASNLAADEMFVDVNYGGCNYVSFDTAQTVTVTVSGTNVNVQFKDLNYSFNNYVVTGTPTIRDNGKMSGNLNFQ